MNLFSSSVVPGAEKIFGRQSSGDGAANLVRFTENTVTHGPEKRAIANSIRGGNQPILISVQGETLSSMLNLWTKTTKKCYTNMYVLRSLVFELRRILKKMFEASPSVFDIFISELFRICRAFNGSWERTARGVEKLTSGRNYRSYCVRRFNQLSKICN